MARFIELYQRHFMRKMNISALFASNPLILNGVLCFTDIDMAIDLACADINSNKPHDYLEITTALSESSYAVLTLDLLKPVGLSNVIIEVFEIRQTRTLSSKPDRMVNLFKTDVQGITIKLPELAGVFTDITSKQESIEYLIDCIKTDESVVQTLNYDMVDFKRVKGTPHNSFNSAIYHNGSFATDYIDSKCSIPVEQQHKIISKVLDIIQKTGVGYELEVDRDGKKENRYLLLNDGELVGQYSMEVMTTDSIVLKDIVKHIQTAQEACLKASDRCVVLDWIQGDYRIDYQPRKYSMNVDFDILAGNMVVSIPEGVKFRKTPNLYLNDYAVTRVQDSQPIFSKGTERLYITNDKDSHHPILVSRDFQTVIPLKVMPKTEMILTHYY